MPPAMLTRDQLVHRLSQVFRRHGYEGASMSRIATETGMGKASLYHHFPEGKAQMAAAVMEDARSWFEQNVFQPLEGVHPPRQRLTGAINALSTYYEEGQTAGMPMVVAVCADRDRMAEPVRMFYQRWIAAMTQVLIDAGLARDIAARRAHDGVERIEGAVAVTRACGDGQVFARMCAELPDQLLAGADRSTVWTVRNRFPAAPAAPRTVHRYG